MIRIHHLVGTRSTRVIWLMEELGRTYELVTHARTAARRSPQAMRDVHPLGKAPTIEDGGTVVGESGAILEYLIRKYDDGTLAPGPSDGEWARYVELLHYAEGSALFSIMALAISGGLQEALPARLKDFFDGEAAAQVAFLDGALGERDYLLDRGFSAADIQMLYVIERADGLRLLQDYPRLRAYQERLTRRPAYGRALARD